MGTLQAAVKISDLGSCQGALHQNQYFLAVKISETRMLSAFLELLAIAVYPFNDQSAVRQSDNQEPHIRYRNQAVRYSDIVSNECTLVNLIFPGLALGRITDRRGVLYYIQVTYVKCPS